ncbi:MAG TPA: hypothetical protein VFU78_04825, partial [Thermomicrobiales bacterium]|nr:hypothetical protein [Thermomicrobiales bacterium]
MITTTPASKRGAAEGSRRINPGLRLGGTVPAHQRHADPLPYSPHVRAQGAATKGQRYKRPDFHHSRLTQMTAPR